MLSLSEEDEEEGKEGEEVPSKIHFRDPKFTSTPNLYSNKNGCNQKVINVLYGKNITNFTPIQAKAFIPVLAVRDIIRRYQICTGKTLAFGIPDVTRICGLAEEKGYSETQTGRMR